MNLNDLSAEDLARIDSICLAFESKVREGEPQSIDSLVSEFGGDYAELLRQELLAIQAELTAAVQPKPIREPFAPAMPPDSPSEAFSDHGALEETEQDGFDQEDRGIESEFRGENEKSPSNETPLAAPTSDDSSDAGDDSIEASESNADSLDVPSRDDDQIEARSEDLPTASVPLPESAVAGLVKGLASESSVKPFASDATEPESDSDLHMKPPLETAVADARAPADDVAMLLPHEGEMLGPYRVGSVIGKGGMGVVYSATDTRLNRLVAIKVLSVGGEKRAELTDRFEREAKAVAALSHPNIVELFDVGVDNGLPYAVMEYLDGESLSERFSRGSLSVNEVRRLGAQVCDALAVAHQGGVVHRDLKPHNVILVRRSGGDDSDVSLDPSSSGGSNTASGVQNIEQVANESTVVKLLDFGLSRFPREGMQDVLGGDDDQATREGAILGTPGYMAPEQARGETATSAADMFSLGCVLFEAFYGVPAIRGETIADRFAFTIEGTPTPDPIRRRDDVALADLIDECLQKLPSERPSSAADLAVRLRRTTPRVDPVVTRIENGYAAGEMLRRRFMTATAGGLVGAVVGGLAAPNHTRELMGVERLAVLSFEEAIGETEATENGLYVAPVSDRDLSRGDKLAALLVNELSRIPSVAVTPFRPMVANNPSEYAELGEQLGVDAFVTGNYWTEERGSKEFANLNLTIVSARTGAQLWGKTIVSPTSDNLLEQTRLAEDVAAAIGHGLTSTAADAKPVRMESFNCLVDGKLRADPDSVSGLEKALKCLEKARNIDQSYVEPHAGIALASVTLAAQSEPTKSRQLVEAAREELSYLEKLRGGMLQSIDARLANAMLAWQTLQRYEEAERELKELAMIAPNNWQVQQQLGLLNLTLGRQQLGRSALKVAKLLYPMSAILKIDYARADWFSGNVEWAKNDARLVLNRVPCPFAKGLLIDIHEQYQDFDKAAAMQVNFPKNLSRAEYFAERRKRLQDQPYGPFGDLLNTAILDLRIKGRLNDFELGELADNQPLMLPLLLAAHPAFSATQLIGRAKDMLPKELTGGMT